MAHSPPQKSPSPFPWKPLDVSVHCRSEKLFRGEVRSLGSSGEAWMMRNFQEISTVRGCVLHGILENWGFLVGILNYTEMCTDRCGMVSKGIEPCSEKSGMVRKGIYQ